MDSSVSSLTASFGKHKVDSTCTGDGPINRLPNEMVQLIMAKLERDGDVKKLVRLRLVSTRWRAVVEDYCRLKKSLCVNFYPNAVPSYCASYFENNFFGFVNFSNFTCLFLSTKILPECLSSLLNMFPNIEQLSIDCSYYFYDRTLDNSLEVYIKSLDSLKLLDLKESSMTQLSRVLSKLEHFSYNCSSAFCHTDDLLRAIPHLGSSCVRANFGHKVPFVCYDHVLQWQCSNPLWFGNLTHLRMFMHSTNEDCARVVHLLSEHAILLQHLDFNTMVCVYFHQFDELRLTPTVLEDLGKLTHLTNLSLPYIEISFSELERSAFQHQLPSLTSVSTCKIRAFIDGDILDYSISGDQFIRVLSVIFPNLVELEATFKVANPTKRNELEMQRQMEQHLGRFTNLSKHKIKFYNLL